MPFLTGCDAIFNMASSPRGVFDAFWRDFKDIYAYMDEHDFSGSMSPEDRAHFGSLGPDKWEEKAAMNFDVFYASISQLADENSTWDKLYTTFTHLEGSLEDPHFKFITLPRPASVPKTTLEQYASYFHEQDDWQVELFEPTYDGFAYGVVKDSRNIGYIYVDQLVAGLPGSHRILEGDELVLRLDDIVVGSHRANVPELIFERMMNSDKWITKIDNIIVRLAQEGVDTLIFDMRSRAGGSFYGPQYIAGRFVEKRAKAIRLLERDDRGRLSRESFIEVGPTGNTSLAQLPMYLLTNKLTRSGGEFLVLMLRTKEDNIVQIGSNTKGSPGGIIEKDLPDGTVVRYPSSKTWQIDTDGSNPVSYFKSGIEPEVSVPDDPDKDAVIEEAIRRVNTL